MACDFGLGERDPEPMAYLYNLVPGAAGTAEDDPYEDEQSPFGGLRRLWNRAVEGLDVPVARTPDPLRVRADWATSMDFSEFAPALGVAFPVWINGTLTAQTVARLEAYGQTLTVPDTTTDWPQVQDRLGLAVRCELPQRSPAAWSVLAVDAAARLGQIREAHARVPNVGKGWHLAARPAVPAPPIALEQQITAAALAEDLDQVRAELSALRAIEADLDVEDPEGPVYEEAVSLLTAQLHAAAKEQGTVRANRDYVPVADDGLVVYSGDWSGPVVDAWKATLTPLDHDERTAALRLRRVRRLLGDMPVETIREFYRDQDGRYAVVTKSGPNVYVWAEWPVSLDVVSTWTDTTVLRTSERPS